MQRYHYPPDSVISSCFCQHRGVGAGGGGGGGGAIYSPSPIFTATINNYYDPHTPLQHVLQHPPPTTVQREQPELQRLGELVFGITLMN